MRMTLPSRSGSPLVAMDENDAYSRRLSYPFRAVSTTIHRSLTSGDAGQSLCPQGLTMSGGRRTLEHVFEYSSTT